MSEQTEGRRQAEEPQLGGECRLHLEEKNAQGRRTQEWAVLDILPPENSRYDPIGQQEEGSSKCQESLPCVTGRAVSGWRGVLGNWPDSLRLRLPACAHAPGTCGEAACS